TSGWLALCSMIWVISIWRPEFWNRWKIPSVQKCYPCSRYILLPMSPSRTRFPDIPLPAKSTIHAVLDRHGLVERRSSRSRRRAQGTALSLGQRPNELWCTDYKGEFLLGNHQYCYPLTVTDHASRYLLTCEALSSTKEDYAFTVFERLFKERGLPSNIRSDNGVPFASAHALF